MSLALAALLTLMFSLIDPPEFCSYFRALFFSLYLVSESIQVPLD